MSTAVERATKGAEMLDQKRPDWYLRVSPATVDIASNTKCVIGQLESRFNSGLKHLGLKFWISSWAFGRGPLFSHGFVVRNYSELGELNAAWIQLICDRRAAARKKSSEHVLVA